MTDLLLYLSDHLVDVVSLAIAAFGAWLYTRSVKRRTRQFWRDPNNKRNPNP